MKRYTVRHRVRDYPPGPRVHFNRASKEHIFCGRIYFPPATRTQFKLDAYRTFTPTFDPECVELYLNLFEGSEGDSKVYHYCNKLPHCTVAYVGDLVRREELLQRYLVKSVCLPIFEEEPKVLTIPFAGLKVKKSGKGLLRVSFDYRQFHSQIAELEGKNLSEYVRDALDFYAQDHHPGLWNQFEEEEK